MALVQNGPGVDDFVPGQMIGDERLGRIAPHAIELASVDGVSRSLSFADVRDTGSFARVPSVEIAAEPAEHVAKRRLPRDDAPAKPKRAKPRMDDEPKETAVAHGIPRYSIFDKGGKASHAGDRK
ncbi:hypothetical protein [Candidatus Burkholderia verschuerenii]|uniref:hypothetical protein n=1 Tax=Candidatus Burkholderia verschuerenii TaxID=242163 RepID=UPI000A677BD6|nr:hypothetical protein [Candidatus Burkholderia verschuerenii]